MSYKKLKVIKPSVGIEPMKNMGDKTIVFLHIPKAAGTTFDSILLATSYLYNTQWERCYGTIYNQYLGKGKGNAYSEFQHINTSKLNTINILTGHLPSNVLESISSKTISLTILRDPIARGLSHYAFGIDRNGWDESSTIETLIKKRMLIDNPQVRQLSGSTDASDICDHRMLERAINTLNTHIDIVGLTEKFDDFLKHLIALFGWPDIVYSNFQNTQTILNDEAKKSLTKEIRTFNQMDIELYKHGKTLYENWAAHLNEMNKDMPSTILKPSDTLLVVSGFVHDKFQLVDRHSFEEDIPMLENQGYVIEYL